MTPPIYICGHSLGAAEADLYAYSRIKRGLEVERVLSRLQKVDLLERILLNDSQKFFLPLLNQNLLTIGDNSSSSSEEEEV